MTVVNGVKDPPPGGEPHSWELPRDRLQLPEAIWTQNKAIVVVHAGPGYGKSTLLSQWHRQASSSGHRVIWLTAEADDRHGDQLLVDLAAALGRTDTAAGTSVLDSYGSEGRLAMVKALLSDLESRERRTVLFIDDVHEVLEQSASSTLRLLLRYQPNGIVLVFSGRSYPSAAFSKPLLEGRLHRFSADQLALNQDEISRMLAQHGIEPRKELIDQLIGRAQGWPAAVRLVALSLQGEHTSQDHLLAGLIEGTQPLTDYLNDAFLSQQSPRIRDFLLRLSVLRNFTLPLAVAATDMPDAGTLLKELDQRALPISRSGAADPRYALHPLVRDFLLEHLKRNDRPLLEEVRDRARSWLAAQGHVDLAIEVSLDTEDPDTAAALIDEHASVMVQHFGRHTTYLHWINKLPQSELSRFPEIRLRQAWSLDFVKQHADAENIRRELEQQRISAPVDQSPLSADKLEEAIELQRCVEAGLQDRAEEAHTRTQRWLARWPDASIFDRGAAHAVLAFSAKSLSDFNVGLQHARLSQELARQCDAPYILAWGHMLAVANLLKRGQYRQALHEATEYVAELDAQLGEWSRAVTMLHALRAGLLYEFNQLPEAGHALDRGLSTLVEESSTDPVIVGYVTLARIQNVQGAALDALETLAEGEALARGRGLPRLAIALGAERAVLLLHHGEHEQAEAVWQEFRHSPPTGCSSLEALQGALEDKSVRIHARTALLQGKHAEACELLAPILRHAKQSGQKKKEVEILILQALALYQSGDERKALSLFSDALKLAMPEGYLRTFADEGAALRPLLSKYLQSACQATPNSPTTKYLEQIAGIIGLSEAEEAAQTTSSQEKQPLVEPLTSRELHILSRLQAGLGNRQLADSLFITEGTLKWHLHNIYGKLAVSSRLAAVARARELGLLDS